MTKNDTVQICVLYPDLLGTYGDGGNATVLQRRLEWRGIDAQVLGINMGEEVPDSCDVYLLGGGEDQPQSAVTDHLMASRALHRAVDKGASVFAVCAGMQVLGESFAVSGGKVRDGLGLLDLRTVRGEGARRVGEITVQPDVSLGMQILTGYENHGGVTTLGPDAKPLGKVVAGRGNDDGKGSEGAMWGKVVGTYLHGPALARNSELADYLLEQVVGEPLSPLNDDDVKQLRSERLSAAPSAGADGGILTKLKALVKP